MQNLIKALTVGIAASVFSFSLSAKTYQFGPTVDAHNMIMFQVNHQGFSRSIGFFTEFSGSLDLHGAELSKSSVTVTISMDSVDLAQHPLWNENTKKFFFDLENHPNMTFASTRVEDLGEGKLTITGDLSLMGVTRPVTLHAQLNKVATDMEVGEKAGFSATTLIKRSDFGMTANLPRIGDEIAITIEIEALEEGTAN